MQDSCFGLSVLFFISIVELQSSSSESSLEHEGGEMNSSTMKERNEKIREVTEVEWVPSLNEVDSEVDNDQNDDEEDDYNDDGGKGDADQPRSKKKKNNMIPLPNFFQAVARSRISERAAVNSGNSLIKDLRNAGIPIPEEFILNKSKIHFGQNVLFTKLSNEPCADTKALSLDGKIFETLEHEKYGENSERNILYKRDNFAVCDGCTEKFIGQFKVTSGTGLNTAEGL
jgi:hypothetical protein